MRTVAGFVLQSGYGAIVQIEMIFLLPGLGIGVDRKTMIWLVILMLS